MSLTLPLSDVLPDNHVRTFLNDFFRVFIIYKPIYYDVTQIRPTKKSATGSRYIDLFVSFTGGSRELSPGVEAPVPPGVLTALPVSIYPLKVLDERNRQLPIDKLAYYTGRHRDALNLACSYYQKHILGIFAFPEAYEGNVKLFDDECKVIAFSLVWAYYKLGMCSYEDTVFRLAHQYGMYVIVSCLFI